MGNQLIANAVVKEQLQILPEDLLFKVMKQIMELVINRKLLREQMRALEKQLEEMHFVFHESKRLPLIKKMDTIDMDLYVSDGIGEFMKRVFLTAVVWVIFIVTLMMAIKLISVIWSISFIDMLSDGIAEHFGVTVTGILLVGMLIGILEISYRDRKNASEIQKKNTRIEAYNQKADKQNAIRQKMNRHAAEADKKRRTAEKKIYLSKRSEVEKLRKACGDTYEKILIAITEMKKRNVVPDEFYEENNPMLEATYYLLQNRIATTLYGSDGALEKARSMIQEEKMLQKVQQIVENTGKTVNRLDMLSSQIEGVHYKLDSMNSQINLLTTSQERMNALLADVRQSSQDAVMAIESQSNAMAKQNKALVNDIDKSIRENSLGKYIYDPGLFGTRINAKDIANFVEGRS